MLGEKSFDNELKLLKRELKAWESMFERKHSRKPNKDDVNNAPEEIKETYVKYNKLKRGPEKNQQTHKDGKDDEVFGKSLNKSKDAGSSIKSIGIQHSPTNYKPIKLCHGQKPRKDSQKNFEENLKGVSQTGKKESGISPISVAFADNGMVSEEGLGAIVDLGFSITSKKQENLNRPGMMLGKSKVTQRMKRRSTITTDWLEKNKPDLSEPSLNETGIAFDASLSENVHDIQDIIPQMDAFENSLSGCSGMRSKSEAFGRMNGPLTKQSSVNGPTVIEGTSLVKRRASDYEYCEVEKDEKNSTYMSHKNTYYCREKTFTNQSKSVDDAAKTKHDGNNNHIDIKSVGTLQTASVDRNKPEIQTEKRSHIRDLVSEKNLSQEEVINLPLNGPKRKRLERGDAEDHEANRWEESYQKQSKIRKTSCSGGESDAELALEEQTSEKRPLKRSSGLVSENFRALNMKVRKFSRRGHGTNYGAYKRRMWKQKQQEKEQGEKKTKWKKAKSTTRAKSSTNSTTTCFKCGEDGHWVKDCPRNKAQTTTSVKWSEPIDPPDDLDIGDEEWQTTENKLQLLLTERLPRAHNTSCNAPPAIEPLYPAENGRRINTPKEVYKALNKLGFETFRSGQEEAIMQILCGLSTLVVLSTGAGKSLCYQLPAYMYNKRSPCLTLVISPLVSLMEDQVVGLPFGLSGVSLNTNMTKPQREKAVAQITSGKAAVVLVSPEALVGGNTGSGCLVGGNTGSGCLPHVSKLPPIAFACIDEAHCLSEWSHNFRPSYLRVCKVLRERFGVRCFLGLTATATRSTALSVAEHLGITQRPDAIIRGAAIPPNLNLSVSCDTNRDRAILELLQGSRFSDCDSIIIYCTRREQTDRLATFLRTCLQKNALNTSSCITEENEMVEMEEQKKGKKKDRKRKQATTKGKSSNKSASWQAECYHAGMTAAQRRRVQKKFMSGELRIVVATVAFGMGLDKANVRAIIHYNLPKSFESYVQEIGRAGRDGLPSHCHVFIDPEGNDVRELRRHAYTSSVDRKAIKKLVNHIFPKCDCTTLHENMVAKREKDVALRTAEADGTQEKISEVQETNGPAGGGIQTEDFDWLDDQMLDHVMELEREGNAKGEEGLKTKVSDKIVDLVDVEAKSPAPAACDLIECPESIQCPESGKTPNDDLPNANSDDPLTDPPVVCAEIGKTSNDDLPNAKSGDPLTDSPAVDSDLSGNDQDSECLRVCGGHEIALPIEKTVQEMDLKEEGIATLLCYLELHSKKWVQIMQPVRSTCTLKFYGGPAHLHFVAQRVPLVTAAVAHAREQQEFKRNTSTLTFPVVEIVDKMGWDLEPARRELYALQWNDSLRLSQESGLSAGHSGILVEFSDLAFHLRAPGDLTDEERDEICDFLEDRIMAQERSQLAQLHGVWSTFCSRAHPNCWQSAEECDQKVDEELKSIVKAYFERKNDSTKAELETLAEARKSSLFVESNVPSEEPVNWDSVARDIRSFINLHGDCELSGRAIARVFHGIDSPCFPAAVWGRDRRFWRRNLDVDFNLLRKFATKELVKFR